MELRRDAAVDAFAIMPGIGAAKRPTTIVKPDVYLDFDAKGRLVAF
jgi:hypothetical protein